MDCGVVVEREGSEEAARDVISGPLSVVCLVLVSSTNTKKRQQQVELGAVLR